MPFPQPVAFTGLSLSLALHPERAGGVRDRIRSGAVSWEQVVWASTSHLVFPALHINYARSGLMGELPDELTGYMEQFTGANREQNLLIHGQALEIAAILGAAGIVPVFLKGVAHLLDGLYGDPGERMMGDIDLLVNGGDMLRAAEVLMAAGYAPRSRFLRQDLVRTKHYPRMVHPERIAAVEIHREVLRPSNARHFPNERLMAGRKAVPEHKNVYVLSDEHQVIHNLLNFQLNDSGHYFGLASLRQQYDLLLLSRRLDPLSAASGLGHYFDAMNANLALTSAMMGAPPSITFLPDRKAHRFVRRVEHAMEFPRRARLARGFKGGGRQLVHYVREFYRFFLNRDSRQSLLIRLRKRKWYGDHFRNLWKVLRGG